MAQFKVYRNPRSSRRQVPYLLDVQSDFVQIGTRLVIPMVQKDFGARLPRINLEVQIAGEAMVLSTADLAAFPTKELKDMVADCDALRMDILAAIDFLLTGCRVL